MSSDSVSVVMPTYNASDYIAGALHSVFGQTEQPHEVIVVDDASSDDTVAIARKLAADAPVPVRVIERDKNSGGPAAPFNDGITAASATCIAALEQDDEMLPERIERQREALERIPGVGLAFGRCRVIRKDRAPELSPLPWEFVPGLKHSRVAAGLHRIDQTDAYAGLITAMYALTCSSFMFPKSTWDACGGFDAGVQSNCDLAFLQKVTERYAVGFVEEPVVNWRMREDSLYKLAQKAGRARDLAFVLKRFDPFRLTPPQRVILRDKIREEGLNSAYACREAGCRAEALGYYAWSIRRGGWSWEALRGMAGAMVGVMIRRSHERDGFPMD